MFNELSKAMDTKRKELEGTGTHCNLFHVITLASQQVAQQESRVYKRDSSGKVLKKDGKPVIDETKSGIKSVPTCFHTLKAPVTFTFNYDH